MFSTIPQKIFLSIYIILLLSIPIGSYIISGKIDHEKLSKISATKLSSLKKPLTSSPSPLPEIAQKADRPSDVLGVSENSTDQTAERDSEVAAIFGPTLRFKTIIEGQPGENQSTKIFLGIIEGSPKENPKFLLSYNIKMPPSGEAKGISLAGLEVGNYYSAILKGPGQIATSSAFVMAPTNTLLNSGFPVTLLSGDLNEDNVINQADLSMLQTLMQTSKVSLNWNENADFNKDGFINAVDLGILKRNFGKVGATGAWIYPALVTPPVSGGPGIEATNSANNAIGASSETEEGTLPDGTKGYWIFVPK